MIPAAARRRRTLSKLSACLAAAVSCAVLSGCDNPREIELRREIDDLQQTLAAKDRQLIEQKTALDAMAVQLAAARGFTPQDLELIFSPVELRIASLSGGADYDGVPGDDGVTVYLQPIDADGDIVKVSGDIRIDLFDLQAPEGETRVGQVSYSAADVRPLWFGKLWTNHYTVKCPFSRTPTNRTITIHAAFTDHLTQRVMTAQQACEIELAP